MNILSVFDKFSCQVWNVFCGHVCIIHIVNARGFECLPFYFPNVFLGGKSDVEGDLLLSVLLSEFMWVLMNFSHTDNTCNSKLNDIISLSSKLFFVDHAHVLLVIKFMLHNPHNVVSLYITYGDVSF